MSRYSENDSYVDPASGTLKNLLGIRDPSKLDAVEADLVAVRSRQLTLRQISGRFDLAHLQATHKYLSKTCTPGQVSCVWSISAKVEAGLPIMPISSVQLRTYSANWHLKDSGWTRS